MAGNLMTFGAGGVDAGTGWLLGTCESASVAAAGSVIQRPVDRH
ncbi:hypothetical protein [Synechococcus lacustris]|nr:hypothetical protein [Synechococcus lacustris]